MSSTVFNQVTPATTASFTTAQGISAAAVVPANTLQIGSTLRVRASGVYSSTGTPTYTPSVFVDGAAAWAAAAFTTGSGVSNQVWVLEVDIVITNTAGGFAYGKATFQASASTVTVEPVPTSAGATAVALIPNGQHVI